jgi:hypothetical protein
MQSFVSRLTNVLYLVSTIKDVFTSITYSKTKHDQGLISQFLQQNKLSIKMIAEVTPLIRIIGICSDYFQRRSASLSPPTLTSSTNTAYASQVSFKKLLYTQCHQLRDLFTILSESLDYPERVLTQNSKKEVPP